MEKVSIFDVDMNSLEEEFKEIEDPFCTKDEWQKSYINQSKRWISLCALYSMKIKSSYSDFIKLCTFKNDSKPLYAFKRILKLSSGICIT